MNGRAFAILDHLSALADTTRSRILLLLERQELSVSEICGVMQLPQSTVSRHLKALADSGWVASRGEGTSNVYTMARDPTQPASASALRCRLTVDCGSCTMLQSSDTDSSCRSSSRRMRLRVVSASDAR